MERDLQEARSGLEEAMRDRANMEKNCKMSQGLIVEANQKLDEMARALSEADSSNKKLQIENQDMVTQIEDTKKLADAEGRDKAALMSKFKNLTAELESYRDRIEEESEKKSEQLRTLSKAQAETQLWRSKFETEGLGRVDEL